MPRTDVLRILGYALFLAGCAAAMLLVHPAPLLLAAVGAARARAAAPAASDFVQPATGTHG